MQKLVGEYRETEPGITNTVKLMGGFRLFDHVCLCNSYNCCRIFKILRFFLLLLLLLFQIHSGS